MDKVYLGAPVIENGLLQIVILFPNAGTFTFDPYPGEEPPKSDLKKIFNYKIVKENEISYAKLVQ